MVGMGIIRTREYKKIEFEHLPVNIYFGISDDAMALRNTICGIAPVPDDNFVGLSTHDGNGNFWMTFSFDATAGTVAHEAFHTLNKVFEHLGVLYAYDQDELPAYMLSYIVDKIMEEL